MQKDARSGPGAGEREPCKRRAERFSLKPTSAIAPFAPQTISNGTHTMLFDGSVGQFTASAAHALSSATKDEDLTSLRARLWRPKSQPGHGDVRQIEGHFCRQAILYGFKSAPISD